MCHHSVFLSHSTNTTHSCTLSSTLPNRDLYSADSNALGLKSRLHVETAAVSSAVTKTASRPLEAATATCLRAAYALCGGTWRDQVRTVKEKILPCLWEFHRTWFKAFSGDASSERFAPLPCLYVQWRTAGILAVSLGFQGLIQDLSCPSWQLENGPIFIPLPFKIASSARTNPKCLCPWWLVNVPAWRLFRGQSAAARALPESAAAFRMHSRLRMSKMWRCSYEVKKLILSAVMGFLLISVCFRPQMLEQKKEVKDKSRKITG